MPVEYWSTEDLCRRYGRSRTTLLRWQSSKGFPKPVIRGGHGALSRWNPEQIKQWEEAQQQAA